MRHKRFKKIKNILFYALIALGFPIIVNLALTEQDPRQFAQESTPIYLIPSSQRVSQGEELIVALQIKAKPQSIKSVQINLAYPQDKLSPPQMNFSNSPFTTSLEEISMNGIVSIAREAPVPVVDEKQIVSLKFKALGEVTPQEIILGPRSFATSGMDNKQLPVNLTVVDSSYYQAQADNGFIGPFLAFLDRILPP
jgi:hypothetical protein